MVAANSYPHWTSTARSRVREEAELMPDFWKAGEFAANQAFNTMLGPFGGGFRAIKSAEHDSIMLNEAVLGRELTDAERANVAASVDSWEDKLHIPYFMQGDKGDWKGIAWTIALIIIGILALVFLYKWYSNGGKEKIDKKKEQVTGVLIASATGNPIPLASSLK